MGNKNKYPQGSVLGPILFLLLIFGAQIKQPLLCLLTIYCFGTVMVISPSSTTDFNVLRTKLSYSFRNGA